MNKICFTALIAFITLLLELSSCASLNEEVSENESFVSPIISEISDISETSDENDNTSNDFGFDIISAGDYSVRVNKDLSKIPFGKSYGNMYPVCPDMFEDELRITIYDDRIYVPGSGYCDDAYTDGEFLIENGEIKKFFPKALNVLEYNDKLYGLVLEYGDGDGACHDYHYNYCNIDEDGSCKIIINDVYDLILSDNKIYYYHSEGDDLNDDGFADNEDDLVMNYCSANLDGTDVKILKSISHGDEYFKDSSFKLFAVCEETLIFSRKGGCLIIPPNGSEYKIDFAGNMSFVSGGYIYYAHYNKETDTPGFSRVNIDGNRREVILIGETGDFVFADHLIGFNSDKIYVFNNDFSEMKTYDYDFCKYDDIIQIIVTDDELTFLLRGANEGPCNFICYDKSGNLTKTTKPFNN